MLCSSREMMHIQVLHLEGHKLQLQLCTEAFLLMTELIFILSDVIFQCIIQFYLRSIISHSSIVVLHFGELMHGPHIKSGHKMNFPENWNGYCIRKVSLSVLSVGTFKVVIYQSRLNHLKHLKIHSILKVKIDQDSVKTQQGLRKDSVKTQ